MRDDSVSALSELETPGADLGGSRLFAATAVWVLCLVELVWFIATGAPGYSALAILGFGIMLLIVPAAVLYSRVLKELGPKKDLVVKAWGQAWIGFAFWRTAEFWVFVGRPSSLSKPRERRVFNVWFSGTIALILVIAVALTG